MLAGWGLRYGYVSSRAVEEERMYRKIRKMSGSPPDMGFGSNTVTYMGIDPSLRGTGVAVIGVDGGVLWLHGWTDKKTLQKRKPDHLSWYKSPDTGHGDRVKRIAIMHAWLETQLTWWQRRGKLVVAIEGYAFSQSSNRASDLHEFSGLIKNSLWRLQIPFRIYDPLSVKMAWTGSGAAEKSQMIMTCYQKFGVDCTEMESAAENLADALLIAHLLRVESQVKNGTAKVGDLPSALRKVILRTTKSEHEALLTKPLIQLDSVKDVNPVYGAGANTWWRGKTP